MVTFMFPEINISITNYNLNFFSLCENVVIINRKGEALMVCEGTITL